MHRRWLTLLALALVSAACVPGVRAQASAPRYPTKPIRLIVGYSPGGSSDILARIVARRLQESLGQTVVVDNRPSTGAIVGAVATAKSPPDGYTLMIGASGPIVINPATHASLPYSPQRDFVAISQVAAFPLILAVKGDSKIASLSELVKYTRANPQLSNYSTSSSTFYLATEMLKDYTALVGENVPYKGSNDSMTSVASGDVTYTMLDPGPGSRALKGRLLRALAVTSATRMAAYPDVPTLNEQGIDLQIRFWIGLFAPAGTPQPIVKLLEREVAKAVVNPDTLATMKTLGLEPTSSTSEAFTARIAQEIQTWTALAREKNIKVD